MEIIINYIYGMTPCTPIFFKVYQERFKLFFRKLILATLIIVILSLEIEV